VTRSSTRRSAAALPWHRCLRYGRNMRSAGWLRSCVLATLGACFLAAVAAPSVAIAAAPLTLPAFVAGPLLNGSTMLWQDTSGLEVLSPGGAPRSLRRGGALSEVSTGGGWIALDTGHALLAGQANGRLKRVNLPRGCLPLPASKPPGALKGRPLPVAHALFAISGSRLLVVVGPNCPVGPRDRRAATRVALFDMYGRRVGLVRRLARWPLAVALAGNTIALFDSITSQGMATTTVLRPSARTITGRTVSTRMWPITSTRIATTSVQIDDAGNVLATDLSLGLHFGGAEASSVVFPVDGKAFQPELRTSGAFSGLSIPARPLVALSDGRLAFLAPTGAHTGSAGESVPAAPVTEIEVLDITTGTPVATIDIAPDNDVLGIAIEGNDLTWIQQPVADVLGPPTTNPSLPTCEFGDSPTGPAIVESADLADLGSTPITVGSSPTPVACTFGQAPP
jgi:hypothetical protein